jgi:hypothetical protein
LLELEVVGRVGKNKIDRFLGQGIQNVDAIALDNLV